MSPWPLPAPRACLSIFLAALVLAPIGAGEAPPPAAGKADAGGTGSREARLLFNAGSRLYRQKSWGEAARTFGDFLERFPDHPDALEARFARGFSLHRLGRHGEAVEDLRTAGGREDAPWSAEAAFYLGRSLEAQADAAADPEERRKLLAAAAAGYGRSAVLYGRPAPPPAAEAESKNEAPVPSRDDLAVLAIASQGEALLRAGAPADAAQALEPLASGPRFRRSASYPRGLYILALARHGMAEKASGAARDAEMAAARKILEILAAPEFEKDPVSEEGLFFLARLLHRGGDRREAALRYAAVIARQGPHAAEASYGRAAALHEAGDGREAAAELARFLAAHSGHALAPRARFLEALILFDGKGYAEAARRLEPLAAGEGELSGPAGLRLGQALLLANPPDPASAEAALERAAGTFARAGAEADRIEALYWRGEALLAREGSSPAGAARLFAEVAKSPAASGPIAEKALYQAARALFLAGNRGECAAAARAYRERSPAGKGRFHAESLALSAENALRAAPGELDEAERGRAAAYFAEAARATADPAQARRLLYRSGIALHGAGDFAGAAEVLGRVRGESRAGPLAGFVEPELPFYLADALIQTAAPGQAAEGASIGERRKMAAGLLEEYLAGSPPGPSAPTALANLGFCRLWLDDPAGAAKPLAAFLRDHGGHPMATRVRTELAGALERTGDHAGALREYRSAAAALEDPRAAARAWMAAAGLESAAGRPAEAVADLEPVLGKLATALGGTEEGRSLLDEARLRSVEALVAAGRAAEARAGLEKLLAASPAGPRAAGARLRLGHILLDAGEPRSALEAVDPVISAPKGSAGRGRALYLRGFGLAALADAAAKGGREEAGALLVEAESAYRKLLAEEPRCEVAPEARVELGSLLFNRQARDEASTLFEEARKDLEEAKRSPDLLDRALFGLAFAAFEGKDHRRARELFDRVAGRPGGPLAPRALFQAGRAWMLAGGFREAADRFAKLADLPAGRAAGLREETLLRLGECRTRTGDPAGAVEALKLMLAEFPAGPLRHEGLFALGFARRSLGDGDAAIDAFRKVAAETDAVVAARAQYHIGECLQDAGKPREAAREFLMVAANFDFGGAYGEWTRRAILAAGLAYRASGEAGAARAQFEDLAARFPETDEGRAARERLAEMEKEKSEGSDR